MDHEGCQRTGKLRLCAFPIVLLTSTLRLQLSNDPSLSSLPLLSTFLKSYSLPFLALAPPSGAKQQVTTAAEPGTLSEFVQGAESENASYPPLGEEELVEKEIRDRFKRMCEGYFDSVSKKLVKEHMVRCRYNVLRGPTANLQDR